MKKTAKSCVILNKPVFVEGKLLKKGTKVMVEEFDDDFIVSEFDDDYFEDDEYFDEEDDYVEDDTLEALRARRARRLRKMQAQSDDPQGEADVAEGNDPDVVGGVTPAYLRRMKKVDDDEEEKKELRRMRIAKLRRMRYAKKSRR